MQIIKGKSVVEHVPADLPALEVVRRTSVGPTVRMCAVGDIGFSGRTKTTMEIHGPDALFKEVAPVLQSADITFGNLESPLAGNIAPDGLFAAPPESADALRNAGFGLIHLANNHIGDFGKAGLTATLEAVREAGMIALGLSDEPNAEKKLIRVDTKDLQIGWLGCGLTALPQEDCGPHYWEFNEDEILAAVRSACATVDVLIVSIHIGLMFLDYPHPDHKVMAEKLMHAGAHLILMHHAHVIQGVQLSDNGHISCYNLGNFLWDYLEGDILTSVMLTEQQEGAIFLFDLDKDGIASLIVLPTWVDNDNHIRWAVNDRGDKILQRLQRISLGLMTNYQTEFDRQRVERNFGHTLRDIAFYARRGDWKYVLNRFRHVRLEHLNQVIRYPFAK